MNVVPSLVLATKRIAPVLLVAVISIGAVGSVGCAAEPAERDRGEGELGIAASAVQGGEPAPSAAFAAFIDKAHKSRCSATLIAPNLVLTARHCISLATRDEAPGCAKYKPAEPAQLAISTLATPLLASKAAYEASLVYAKEIFPAPERPNGCAPDLALIVLERNIDGPVATPSFATTKSAYTLGKTLGVVGYGIDDAKQSGVRRERRGIDVLCVAGDESRPCDGGGMQFYARDFEFVTGPGPCIGDSGGGIFDDASLASSPIVVGVVSRGNDIDKICDEGIHVRVDTFADFIAETAGLAAKTGGYTAPAWAKMPVEPAPAAPETPEAAEAKAPESSPASSSCTASGARGAPSASRASSASSGVAMAMAIAIAVAIGRRHRRPRQVGFRRS